MSEMAYSLHLGSDKNRKISSKFAGKGNLSKSTSLSNNAIQNAQQLSRVDKHNYRKYDGEDNLIHIIKGTDSVYRDIRDLYVKEFDEARIKYNKKQSRPSRMIEDYFENVSQNEKKDLACEIIIELGDKEYWDTKDEKFKLNMINVYNRQVSDLEKIIPNFKIASAIVHLDETSPHLHIVGVPIKYGGKNGMSKQVGKSDVFTKDSLKSLQDRMRNLCIKEFNDIYGLDSKLKKKEKGRNRDINVKNMTSYQEVKKQLDINKKAIDKQKKKMDNIASKLHESNYILNNLEHKGLTKYLLSHSDKKQLESLVSEITKINNEFKDLTELTITLEAVNIKLESQESEIKNLKERNINNIRDNNYLERKNIDLRNDNDYLNFKLSEFKYNTMKTISKQIHEDYTNKKQYIKMINNLEKNKVLYKSECKLCLQPIFRFSKCEVENALRKLNQEDEEAAEDFYGMNKKNKNKDDYQNII
jgi:hypothetical protein